MRHDIQNQLSVAQAFTATALGDYSYKKASASQRISIGRRMALWVCVTVAAGAGSSHVLAAVQADDAALTTNLETLNSLTKAAATLVAGYQCEIPIPENSDTRLYLGFKNTISSGTTTVTLDVYLVPQDEITQKFVDFPKVVDAEV